MNEPLTGEMGSYRNAAGVKCFNRAVCWALHWRHDEKGHLDSEGRIGEAGWHVECMGCSSQVNSKPSEGRALFVLLSMTCPRPGQELGIPAVATWSSSSPVGSLLSPHQGSQGTVPTQWSFVSIWQAPRCFMGLNPVLIRISWFRDFSTMWILLRFSLLLPQVGLWSLVVKCLLRLFYPDSWPETCFRASEW